MDVSKLGSMGGVGAKVKGDSEGGGWVGNMIGTMTKIGGGDDSYHSSKWNNNIKMKQVGGDWPNLPTFICGYVTQFHTRPDMTTIDVNCRVITLILTKYGNLPFLLENYA